MKVYIWILELGGVAGLFLLGRFLWHRFQARGERAAHNVRQNRNAVSRAERDRLDIEALANSMTGDEPVGAPRSKVPGARPQPSSDEAREARGRRAAGYSSFDPDLPAPKKDASSQS